MNLNNEKFDLSELKKKSEEIILSRGGKICDWLPKLQCKGIKSVNQIIRRASVMNALSNIAFEAPTEIILDWIKQHDLLDEVSNREKAILQKETEMVTMQEKIDLRWYIEGVWALLWVGGIIDDLPFDRSVEDFFVTLVPDLEQGEDNSKIEKRMQLRSELEIYKMADLYYRLHWFTTDARINKYSNGNINDGVIMERRRTLSWVIDPNNNWDEVDMNT